MFPVSHNLYFQMGKNLSNIDKQFRRDEKKGGTSRKKEKSDETGLYVWLCQDVFFPDKYRHLDTFSNTAVFLV